MLSMAHQDSSLEEDIILNNGRIDFNENIFNTENHYLICAAIEKFRDWRSRLEKMNYIPTLADIPEVFADLIAVLVHERDGSVEQLATNIDYILSPFDRDIKSKMSRPPHTTDTNIC
ncbi:hypothetical protein BDB01DRAFT_61145 [Pilobolus umbonatus]|nr:hypothetical protein BDB01DRAFT_61145 [Pilobolus umbonatus]